MSMNITKSFLVFLFLVTSVTLAAGKTTLPDGGVESPYESCKSVVIVSKDKYQENEERWKALESKCKIKVQVALESGLSKFGSLE